MKTWSQTPLNQSFLPYIFSIVSVFSLMWWYEFFTELLAKFCDQNNHAKMFSVFKNNHAKMFSVFNVERVLEIFISCFLWLACNNDNRDFFFGLEKCISCWFDLSPERWTWQNAKKNHIENWWDPIRIQDVVIIISYFFKVKMSWRSYHE